MSIREGTLKYVARMPGDFDELSGSAILSEEPYHLAGDPTGQCDLSATRRADVAALREQLRAFVRKAGGAQEARGVREPVPVDPETREQLRALGDVR